MTVACRDPSEHSDAPGADDATTGAFSATDSGWSYAGGLTLANAAAVLQASLALPLPVDGTVDVSGLRHADSAALAVLIALERRAASEGATLAIVGIPQPLRSLATVYGVDELLA